MRTVTVAGYKCKFLIKLAVIMLLFYRPLSDIQCKVSRHRFLYGVRKGGGEKGQGAGGTDH